MTKIKNENKVIHMYYFCVVLNHWYRYVHYYGNND